MKNYFFGTTLFALAVGLNTQIAEARDDKCPVSSCSTYNNGTVGCKRCQKCETDGGKPNIIEKGGYYYCLLYTSPSPRDATLSRMPSSA